MIHCSLTVSVSLKSSSDTAGEGGASFIVGIAKMSSRHTDRRDRQYDPAHVTVILKEVIVCQTHLTVDVLVSGIEHLKFTNNNYLSIHECPAPSSPSARIGFDFLSSALR
ncbi:unnamed protein product [Angiostrongylus costaricensis]|uniref:Uncharacterized protein n=1 Tax=Angiostrongylus costaricensis TaxID=334426 RepID=A0A0R3P9U2_ANGCS|nr:unnamed protein product [Angiostrongylus costaricensis]